MRRQRVEKRKENNEIRHTKKHMRQSGCRLKHINSYQRALELENVSF